MKNSMCDNFAAVEGADPEIVAACKNDHEGFC